MGFIYWQIHRQNTILWVMHNSGFFRNIFLVTDFVTENVTFVKKNIIIEKD